MKKALYEKFDAKPVKRLIPLFLIVFIDSFSYFLILPVLMRLFFNTPEAILPASTSTGARDILYGFTVMLSPLASLIFAPLIGNLSDRYGRKKILSYCLCGSGLGFLLPIFGIYTRNFSLLLLGRFITGAASSNQPVAQAAITDFTSGKRKAFYLSMIAFAMTLALLGPLAGSYLSDAALVSWFNITTPYWLGFFLAVINIFLLLMFFHDHSQIRIKSEKKSITQRIRALIDILMQNKIISLLLIFFCLEFAWSQYYQSIMLFLTQKFQYTPNQVGLFTGYIGFWMSLGLTIIYRIMIRYLSVEQFLLISLIGAAIGLIGTSIDYTPVVEWIFIIPVAVFTGTAYASLLAVISNRTAVDHQGWVFGFIRSLLSLSWIITALLSSVLLNIFLPLPLIVAAIAMSIAALIFLNW